MTTYETIQDALNVEARIEDLIVELENIPSETIEISHVARKLRVILCRASDARHELSCREADFGGF